MKNDSRIYYTLIILMGLFSPLGDVHAFNVNSTSAQPVKEEKAPTEDEIKKSFQKWYDDTAPVNSDKSPQLIYTLKFSKVTIFPPRLGNMYTDGVPEENKINVWPVKVTFTVTTLYVISKETKDEEKEIEAVFFKDDYSEWTWKLKSMK